MHRAGDLDENLGLLTPCPVLFPLYSGCPQCQDVIKHVHLWTNPHTGRHAPSRQLCQPPGEGSEQELAEAPAKMSHRALMAGGVGGYAIAQCAEHLQETAQGAGLLTDNLRFCTPEDPQRP